MLLYSSNASWLYSCSSASLVSRSRTDKLADKPCMRVADEVMAGIPELPTVTVVGMGGGDWEGDSLASKITRWMSARVTVFL